MKSAKSFVVLGLFPLDRGSHRYTLVHQRERALWWLFLHSLHISLANLTQGRDELQPRFDRLHRMFLTLEHISPRGTAHPTSMKEILVKNLCFVKYSCGHRFTKHKYTIRVDRGTRNTNGLLWAMHTQVQYRPPQDHIVHRAGWCLYFTWSLCCWSSSAKRGVNCGFKSKFLGEDGRAVEVTFGGLFMLPGRHPVITY